MSRKTSKMVETPSGAGEIRKAGEHLANVFYRLQVRREIIISESAGGKEEIPGRLDISGEVTVSAEERMNPLVLQGMNSGELLTLHLSDGHCLEVYATRGDLLNGTYHVVPGSSAGFV